MPFDLARQLERLARRILAPRIATPPRPPVDGPAVLRRQGEQFRRAIREVAPGVHVALGYGLANVILIECGDVVVLIDTLESEEAAHDLAPELARIAGQRPVDTIIYTHNHADHIYGSAVFGEMVEGQTRAPRVIAHRTTAALILKIAGILRPIIFTRSMRQFGPFLGEGDHLNSGIGPELRFDPSTAPRLLWPTEVVDDRLELEIGNRRFELGHVPGETPDHLYVWLPDDGVLIPGDNYYHTFPNLYAIRGTAYRDVLAWARSVDTLLELDAEVLVPCHTLPVLGRAEIRERLANYRDAILFVHDQTIRWMNRGLVPDEIVERVELPPHLRDLPYLQELYGRVDWSVRSIFAGTLGWFSGDARDLHPIAPRAHAERMVALAGGAANLLRAAEASLARNVDRDDAQWALELAGVLLALEPTHERGRALRARALRAMAERETSANGRNYYLTQARETEGSLETPRSNPAVSGQHMLAHVPIATTLRSMAVNLEAERALETEATIGLHFTDLDEDWSLEIRRGVALEKPGRPAQADVRLRVDSGVFKEMLVGIRAPATTLASRAVAVEGSTARLVQLLLFNAN